MLTLKNIPKAGLKPFFISLILLSAFSVFAQEKHQHPKEASFNELKHSFLNSIEQPEEFDNTELVARFMENKGQWNSNILYRTELINGYIYFENNNIKYHFYDKTGHYDFIHEGLDSFVFREHLVDVEFLNTNKNKTIQASTTFEQPHISFHYSKKSYSDVTLFGQIKYTNIYEKIDLIYKSYIDHLKYDFVVAPEGKTSAIAFKYTGTEHLYLHGNGSLVAETSIGGIAEYTPYSYQIINGKETEVKCHFELNNGIVSFAFPLGYDSTKELIIDPSLVASSYTGSTSDNWGFTAANTPQEEMVVAGITDNIGYPTTLGAFQTTFNGGFRASFGGLAADISISVFSADGTTLLASSYLGGRGDETPHSLVVSKQGEIYLMGKTLSNDFPVTSGVYDSTFNGGVENIFIARLNSSLTSILSCTYIGGTGQDGVNVHRHYIQNTVSIQFSYGDGHRGQLVLDKKENVYVTSSTRSTDFPTTAGAYQSTLAGGQDAVVFKMDSNLSTLFFSTYLGGFNNDGGYSLAVDTSQNVYITGATESFNFPTTTGALDQTYGGNVDGYVSKLDSTGSTLLASTFLGTGNKDGGFYVDLDFSNNVYIYGLSYGGSYPVTAGTYNNAGSSQFIHGLDSSLSTTNFSTVFGSGSAIPNINPTGFEVDSCSKIICAGWGRGFNDGSSFGMPTSSDAFQSVTDGIDFYFITFDPNASSMRYATYFGQLGIGDHVDGGSSTFGDKGVIYQAVCASCDGSNGFPTSAGAYSSVNNSSKCNNAVFKFDLDIFSPAAAAIGVLGSVCLGIPTPFANNSSNAISYEWDFDDGTPIDTNRVPQHAYHSEGEYTVTLVATNPNTCIQTDTARLDISIIEPSITFSSEPDSGLICQGDSIVMTANGALTYIWSHGLPPISKQVLFPNDSTVYEVIGVDTNGCTDTSYTTVLVNLATQAIAGSNQTLCILKDSTTLEADSLSFGVGFWKLISGRLTFEDTLSATSKVTNIAEGKNILQWTTRNDACPSDSSQMNITVFPITIADAGEDQELCSFFTLLEGNSLTSLENGIWTITNGSSILADSLDPTTEVFDLSPNKNNFLWVVSNNVCPSDSDEVLVDVNIDCDGDGVTNEQELLDDTDPNDPCDYLLESITLPITNPTTCGLEIPDAFSPNGDGINDYFIIKGIEKYPYNKIFIFNRWGNKIFEARGYLNEWDGASQFGIRPGENIVPTGTYFYILDLGVESLKIQNGYIYLNK